MRTVLSNGSEVYHVFAQGVQDRGRAGNTSFDYNTAYSYSAAIGYIDIPANIAILCRRSWSVTTSGHQSMLRQAVSHFKHIYVYELPYGYSHIPTTKDDFNKDHESNIAYFVKQIEDIQAKQTAAQKYDYSSDYSSEVTNFRNYVKYFRIVKLLTTKQKRYYHNLIPLVIPKRVQEYDLPESIARREKAAAYREDHADEIAAAKQRKIENQLSERIQKFRNHETNSVSPLYRRGYRYHNYDTTAYLRLSLDKSRIETSKGAQVLVNSAHVLWNTIVKTREKGVDYKPIIEVKIDYYTLSVIKANGDMVIGCHNIPYMESERIAKELNWIE